MTSVGIGVILGALIVAVKSVNNQETAHHDYQLQSGKEIVVVLIGSQSCGASKVPAFLEAMDTLRVLLQVRSGREGFRFSLTGVALDWSPAVGLGFLESLGDFDEMIVGRNWLNTGALRYVWKDIPGPASVPQILVLERDVEVGPAGVTLRTERPMARVVGTDRIIEWVRDGAPFRSPFVRPQSRTDAPGSE
jgi:hypothetical protein